MNILNIEQQVQLLQTIGYTLNTEEKQRNLKNILRLRLKLAHIKLMTENIKLDEIKFWGRIQTINKSYYILQGLIYCNYYEFPHKIFYWSSIDFIFKQLPQLLLQHQGLNQQFNSILLSGDASKILKNLQGQGQQQIQVQENNDNPDEGKKQIKQEDDDQDIKKMPKKNYTELHRLTHIIYAIENDVQCIPRDSYRMNSNHQLHPNPNFHGLNPLNCKLKTSWLHFRSPQTIQARQKIQEESVVFNADFLDTLEGDLPEGTWSLQIDAENKNVSIRSLSWPGYYGFHKINSSNYGSLYVGNGLKNVDLPFMLTF